MTDLPFGFGDAGRPGDGGPGGSGGDSGAGGFGSSGFDPFGFGGGDLGAMLQQLGRMLSAGDGGPVNWTLAEETARQALAAAGDPAVTDAELAGVTEAVATAETWLDAVTALPAGSTRGLAWSRSEWVAAAMPVLREVVEPIAEQATAAQVEAMPEQLQAMAGPMLPMLRQMGAGMMGMQVGQGLAALAQAVLSGDEVGLPITPAGTSALLPAAIRARAADLDIDMAEVQLDSAVREAAIGRLFAHVPWLQRAVMDRVVAAGRTVSLDAEALGSLLNGVDPADPESLQRLMSGGGIAPADTPERRAALSEVETLLALVAGWVAAVTAEAVGDRLPNAAPLAEAARRRAAIGPAQEAFETLIGLELRPQRIRQAAALWQEAGARFGIDDRDGWWEHPGLLPTASDLDDPADFLDRHAPVQIPDDLSGL